MQAITQTITNNFALYHGDSCEVIKSVPDNSIGISVFSRPFGSMYTYSNSERDLGNCRTQEEFLNHFRYLAIEMFRVTKPGRHVVFHCMNMPAQKERDGFIGLKDFRGDLIRLFQSVGFIYHSEVVIWKDPVTAMQRTKALGLLHKTIRGNSAMTRQGIPDYVITMRKPGVDVEPVTHTHEQFPINLWQRYASPVWADIVPNNTLQKKSARDNEDERHICPLQLDVIERCLMLWTNPGDIVASWFAGIGSEGYVAIQMGRKFLGVELKESYYNVAKVNLENIEEKTEIMGAVEYPNPYNVNGETHKPPRFKDQFTTETPSTNIDDY